MIWQGFYVLLLSILIHLHNMKQHNASFFQINILISNFCLLHVSNQRVHLQEEGCIYSCGVVRFTVFIVTTTTSAITTTTTTTTNRNSVVTRWQ